MASAQTPVSGVDSETLRRALALVRAWRDPAMPALVFLPLLAVAGCGVLVVAVVGMASMPPHVALQVPYLVSGGFGGVALVMCGVLLAAVQAERRDRVAATAETQEVADEVCALTTAALRRYGGAGMAEQEGRHRAALEQTERADYVDDARQPENADRERGDLGRPPPRWKALLTPAIGIWTSLAVVAVGIVSIFYSWGEVAGTLEVANQIPPLILAGFSGLALIAVGIAAVNISARFQDRPERMQQVSQVARSVGELRDIRSGR